MFFPGLILLIAVVFIITGREHPADRHPIRVSNAEELLKKRFVAGDIDEDTYESMLRTLRNH